MLLFLKNLGGVDALYFGAEVAVGFGFGFGGVDMRIHKLLLLFLFLASLPLTFPLLAFSLGPLPAPPRASSASRRLLLPSILLLLLLPLLPSILPINPLLLFGELSRENIFKRSRGAKTHLRLGVGRGGGEGVFIRRRTCSRIRIRNQMHLRIPPSPSKKLLMQADLELGSPDRGFGCWRMVGHFCRMVNG